MAVAQNNVHHPLAVQVGPGQRIELVAQEPFGLAPHFPAIGAGQRAQVELEARAGRREAPIICMVHIKVSFRVGEDRVPAGAADAVQQAVQVHRGREAAGLDQQRVAPLSQREQVAGFEPKIKIA